MRWARLQKADCGWLSACFPAQKLPGCRGCWLQQLPLSLLLNALAHVRRGSAGYSHMLCADCHVGKALTVQTCLPGARMWLHARSVTSALPAVAAARRARCHAEHPLHVRRVAAPHPSAAQHMSCPCCMGTAACVHVQRACSAAASSCLDRSMSAVCCCKACKSACTRVSSACLQGTKGVCRMGPHPSCMPARW